MKRLIILTILIIVLISTTVTKAQYGVNGDWPYASSRSPAARYPIRRRSSYGRYGYGYRNHHRYYTHYGSDRSLLDALFGWTDDREFKMMEKEQEFRHQQERAKIEQAEIERQEMFARAKALKGKQSGQENLSENKNLRQEIERLKLENEKLQLELKRKELLKVIEKIEAEQTTRLQPAQPVQSIVPVIVDPKEP